MVSLFIAFCTEDVTGDTIIIEPGDDYTKIENARAGDIVEIAPGAYQFRVRLSAHGTNTEPITIRARDADNRPVFDLSGDWCGNWPGSWSNNRAIFHIEGSYYKICDLIFRGAHQVINSADASGIRTVQADNISVQNCLFEYNDNGIQGSGDSIVYKFCEFRQNGKTEGQSGDAAHNIYTHGGTFTFLYCYIHDPLEGLNIHSRSRIMVVACCLIENARTYTSDIMVDSNEWVSGQPLYQSLTYSGCIIKESPEQINDTKAFTMVNSPARDGVYMKLNLFYNTFIGNDNNGAIVRFTESGLAGHELNMFNNIFYQKHDPLRFDGESVQKAVVSLNNNWWPDGYDYSPDSTFMSHSVFGTYPGFLDTENDDFRLSADAQVRGRANEALCAAPPYEFDLEAMQQVRYIERYTAMDLGAHEYSAGTAVVDPHPAPHGGPAPAMMVNNIELRQNYPNPFNPSTTLSYSIQAAGSMSLIIYDIRGREIKKLAAGRQTAGTYKIVWEGFDNSGRQAAEGIYFAFLKVNNFQRVIRLILVR